MCQYFHTEFRPKCYDYILAFWRSVAVHSEQFLASAKVLRVHCSVDWVFHVCQTQVLLLSQILFEALLWSVILILVEATGHALAKSRAIPCPAVCKISATADTGLVNRDTIVPSLAWAKYGQRYTGTDLCPLTNFTTVTTEAAGGVFDLKTK